jgi:hypothetical protein
MGESSDEHEDISLSNLTSLKHGTFDTGDQQLDHWFYVPKTERVSSQTHFKSWQVLNLFRAVIFITHKNCWWLCFEIAEFAKQAVYTNIT